MTTNVRRHRPELKRAAVAALLGAALLTAAQTAAATDDEAPALTPLGRAAHSGDLEAAQRQLRKGADVDAVSAEGMTPLMWSFQPLIRPPKTSGEDPAALQAFLDRQRRKLRIARLLLNRGADIARVDRYGMTALHFLTLMAGDESPLIETLQAFMAKGADPNVSNVNGQTPLMFAAQKNRPQLVQALLAAGADPKTADKDGHTALSIARERGHTRVAEVLERKLP